MELCIRETPSNICMGKVEKRIADIRLTEGCMNRKKLIRTISICFIVLMFILTFFSNTIMNYSLPEVSGSMALPGTIADTIRGTGTAELNKVYSVNADADRVIKDIEVEVGDEVEEGDVLFYLEASDNTELKDAKTQLNSLQLEYDKLMLSYNKKNMDIENAKTQLEEAKKELEAATGEESIDSGSSSSKNLQKRVDDLTEQKTNLETELTAVLSEGDISPNGTEGGDLYNAESVYTQEKDSYTAVNSELENVNAKITLLESQVSNIQSKMSKTVNDAQEDLKTKKRELTALESELSDLQNQGGDESQIAQKQLEIEYKKEDIADAEDLLNNLEGLDGKLTDLQNQKDSLQSEAFTLQDDLASKKNSLYEAGSKLRELLRSELLSVKKSLKTAQESLDSIKENSTEDVEISKKSYKEASKEVRTLEQSLEALSVENDNNIENLKLEIDSKERDIESQKELIEQLREKYEEGKITSTQSGKVSAINYKAGDSVTADNPVVTIQLSEYGYKTSFSVTTEQAKRVKVGDTATVQTSSYDSDVSATLAGISDDSDNLGKNKILTFDISGNVINGQTLSISMSEKKQSYDIVVPKSAIKEDNNGKYVFTLQTKSSVLGTKYFADKIYIQVQKSDETNAAISGGFYTNNFIITTSSKPLEDGKQVRLAD